MATNGGRPQCGEYGGFATAAIHAGQEPDPATGAVVPPISLATTFSQVRSCMGYDNGWVEPPPINPTIPATQASPGVKHGLEHANSFGKGFEYSRTGNPTRGAFERAMAAVEHGKHAVAFASGLAATVRCCLRFRDGRDGKVALLVIDMYH